MQGTVGGPTTPNLGAQMRTGRRELQVLSSGILGSNLTWALKVCEVMALWAILGGFGPLFYILLSPWKPRDPIPVALGPIRIKLGLY